MNQEPIGPGQQSDETPKDETQPVPSSWPGGFGLYKYSKAAVKQNLGTILSLLLLGIILALLPYLFVNQDSATYRMASIVTQIAGIFVSVAAINAYLASIRRQKVSVEEMLRTARPTLVLNYLISSILVAVAMFVSILLFVIPFFFVMPRLLLSPYYLIDKKLGPFEALQASWEASKDHVGEIYNIILATIALSLLALTIVGIPFAIYFVFMYGAAQGITYMFIDKSHVTVSSASPTAPQLPTA